MKAKKWLEICEGKFFLQVSENPYHHNYLFFWHSLFCPASLPFSIQLQKLK